MKTMVEMVDAAMVEMTNITPPLRRSECERLIRAALAVPAPEATESERRDFGPPVDDKLTESELDFVRLVHLRPGCKLNGPGEAVVDEPEYFCRWSRPQELGYIVAVGSYKWRITGKGFKAIGTVERRSP